MELNLEQVDVDGAIAEAHEEAMGDTRANFLRKAGLGAGAFIGGGAVLGAFASSAMASGSGAAPGGAVGILNYALTLEYLERAFYEQATANGIANRDGQLINYLRTTTRDEKAHVSFLQKALGRKAIKEPKFDFGKAVKDRGTFAATSYVLENTGVHAYLGQLPYILGSPTYAAAAASIVTIEARHSGAIALYLGKNIDNPGSFDKGESYDTIIKAVKGTGFLK